MSVLWTSIGSYSRIYRELSELDIYELSQCLFFRPVLVLACKRSGGISFLTSVCQVAFPVYHFCVVLYVEVTMLHQFLEAVHNFLETLIGFRVISSNVFGMIL